MAPVYQPLVRVAVCTLLAMGVVGGHTPDAPRPAQPEDLWAAARAQRATADSESLRLVAHAERATPPVAAPSAPDSLFSIPAVDEAERLYRICRVTAYCDRGKTAANIPSGVGQCAAPGYVPLGSLVYIPALDEVFVVTDRTHRRFRNSTIDIFMPSKTGCRNFGRHFWECEIIIDPPTVRAARLGRR